MGDGALTVDSGATMNLDNATQTISDLNGSGTLNLNGDTLTTTGSGTDSFSGVIGEASGTGALVMDGSGTLTLSGDNTYSGGTTLDSGTTSISAADNLGTGGITFNGGTLETTSGLTDAAAITTISAGTINNNGNDDTFSGVISGGGGMTFTGSGTTTLSGGNTYTGGTTLAGGTTSIGAADNLGTGGITLNGGALSINASAPSIALANSLTIGSNGGELIGTNQTSLDPTTNNALTLTGSMFGSGALQTAGTIIDNGTGGTTGGTTVTSGLLEVGDINHSNASLSGSVSVDSGAFLRGHGAIIGNVGNAGTVFPGGTIGILTINGNYTQSPAGTLDIQVSPSTSNPPVAGVDNDELAVNGAASLAGTLEVYGANENAMYAGQRYTILTASNGVSGTFSTVLNENSGGYASYIYPSVSYTPEDVYLTIQGTPKAFHSGNGVVDSPNATNVSLFSTIDTLMDGAQQTKSGVFTHSRLGGWTKGFGGFGHAYGANVEDYGGVAGYGRAINQHLVLGAAFTGSGTGTTTSQQTVDTKDFGGFLYAIDTQGQLRISGTLGGGGLQENSTRNLSSLNETATGFTDGWYFGTGIQAQYLIPEGNGFVMPYGKARYLHTGLNGYKESGAGNLLDLYYGGINTNLGAFTAGVRTGYDFHTVNLTLVPWISVGGTAYAGNRHVSQVYTLGFQSESEVGIAAPSATVDTGVGLTIQGDHSPWTAKVAYNGQYANSETFNTFDLLASYRW